MGGTECAPRGAARRIGAPPTRGSRAAPRARGRTRERAAHSNRPAPSSLEPEIGWITGPRSFPAFLHVQKASDCYFLAWRATLREDPCCQCDECAYQWCHKSMNISEYVLHIPRARKYAVAVIFLTQSFENGHRALDTRFEKPKGDPGQILLLAASEECAASGQLALAQDSVRKYLQCSSISVKLPRRYRGLSRGVVSREAHGIRDACGA